MGMNMMYMGRCPDHREFADAAWPVRLPSGWTDHVPHAREFMEERTER